MAELFGIEVSTTNYHLKEIFKSKELDKNSTIRIFRIVQKEGKREVLREIEHYNLDVIISLGYRVNSIRATQFRKWATQIIKSYMINGYAINEKRIKDIENKIDNLSTEIRDINKSLLQIANRPITISLASSQLESKIIDLLDELIIEIKKDKKLKNQVEEIKTEIKRTPKDKNKIISFFSKLGDEKSNLSQTIKGVGVSKKVIAELIKLGEKLKDLIF